VSAPVSDRRAIALGFVDAVRPALAPGASPVATFAACDVARMMDLPGLATAFAELARHASAPRPAPVEHLASRVGRLLDRAVEEGDLGVFTAADRELEGLASQLAATEWSHPGTASEPAVATLRADTALADLTLAGSAEACATRLTLPVASAVRAAIDWLGADEAPRVTLDAHDAALTITVAVTHAGGIGPAGAVLAGVEGSLGRESDGRWTMRVAAATERPSFLLLHQGRYGIALPWHAVARLRMFAPHELERLPEPVLDPLSTAPPAPPVDRPAALVALGLARAWFVADRIVWRIAAHAEALESPAPFGGVTRRVSLESGDSYWVLEPAWLLRGVAPPEVAPPSPRPRVSTTTLEALPAAPAEPAPVAAPAPAAPTSGESLANAVERALAQLRPRRDAESAVPPPPERSLLEPPPVPGMPESERLEVTTFEHAAPEAPAPPVVLPHVDVIQGAAVSGFDTAWDAMFPPETEAAPEPASGPQAPEAASATPAPAVPAAPEAAPRTPAAPPAIVPPASAPQPAGRVVAAQARRALVADDSLVARIFLGRLLERRGWIVETVGDAAALWDELPRGPWGLVCADIALPDAQGAGHVRRLREHLERRATPVPLIVLTRDLEDERAAAEGGVTHVLRKPFDPARLESLLPR
jgi:CheY-like chemotaxis protein